MTSPAALPARELDARVAREVMGLDLTANSDERIARAVTSGMRSSYGDGRIDMEWGGERFDRVRLVGTFNVGAEGNDAYGLALWRDRYGKPWQVAIERHVREWSMEPAPYSTDWRAMGTVLDALRERGHGVRINDEMQDGWTVAIELHCDPHDRHEATAGTLPRAAAEAALAAVGGK